jgi:Tfp pilus assembly protein PilF
MAYFIKNPTEALKLCDEVLELDPHYLCAYGQKADIYTAIDQVKTR